MKTGERVKEVIEELLALSETPTENDHIMNDLGADSLDTVELIMELEKEFSISIPDEDVEQITTVGDCIKYVDNKVG